MKMAGEGTSVGRIYVELGVKNDFSKTLPTITAGLNSLQNGFNKTGQTIKTSFSESLSSATKTASSSSGTISKALSGAFSGIGSKIQSALSGAKNAISSFASSASNAFKGLVSAGEKVYQQMGFIGTAMVAVFTNKLKGAITEAVDVFMTFDDQMRKVQAVTESSGETFDKLTAQAKLLGATTSFTAQEAADAMTMLGQAGFNANQVIAAMPATLNLARGSMTDLATTADIMSNIMNGFRIAAEDTTRVADVLTKAANATNTDVTGLGDAMKYVAPLAYQMGWSLEETASAAGLLSNAGIKSSMAGTVLRNSISRLLSPTQKAAGILESYGISLDAISPKTHNFAQIVDLLSQKQVSAADIMQVFGMRAGPGMLAMMNIGTAAIQGMNQTLYESEGYAQRAADAMDAGWGGVVRRLGDAVEALQISFGGAIAKILTPFAEAVSWIGVKISQLPAPIIYLGAAFALAAVAAGTLLTALAALPTIAGVLSAGFSVASAAVVKLSMFLVSTAEAGGILGSVAGTLASAMGALASVSLATVGWVAAIGAALWVLEQKTQVFSKSWTFLKDLFTIGSYYIGKAFDNLKTVISKAIDEILADLKKIADDTGLTYFVDAVTSAYDKISSYLGKTASSVHDSAESIRTEEKKQAESAANVQKQIEAAHSGTVTSYQAVDEATGQTYVSMIENAEAGADGVTSANSDIVSSNESLVASNNAVTESSPKISYALENTDIASISDPLKGTATLTVEAINNGIELADGSMLKFNESGQLVIETLDGVQKRLYDIGNTSLELQSGGKVWTMTDNYTVNDKGKIIDNGPKKMVSLKQANASTKEEEKAMKTPEYTAALWQEQHPNDTMLYLNKDVPTPATVPKIAHKYSNNQVNDMLVDKAKKDVIESKVIKVGGATGQASIERGQNFESGLLMKGQSKPKLDKDAKITFSDGSVKTYTDALKEANRQVKVNKINTGEAVKETQGWTSAINALLSGDWTALIKPVEISKTETVNAKKETGNLSKAWELANRNIAGTNVTNASLLPSIDGIKNAYTKVTSISFDGIKNSLFGVGEESKSSALKADEQKGILDSLSSISMSPLIEQIFGVGDESDKATTKGTDLSDKLFSIDGIQLPNIQSQISTTAMNLLDGITNSDTFRTKLGLVNSVKFDGLLSSISTVSTSLNGLITTAETMYSKVKGYVTDAISGKSDSSNSKTTKSGGSSVTNNNKVSNYYVSAKSNYTSEILTALKNGTR